jgi:hypothetical protein
MADFEVFRAALREVEGRPGARRLDLNLDGQTDDVAIENNWPRTDLNGSGKLSRDPADRRMVKGRLSSDLEVMMRVWQDPSVPKDKLPGML